MPIGEKRKIRHGMILLFRVARKGMKKRPILPMWAVRKKIVSTARNAPQRAAILP